jgi:predicted transposase/invertase (TIGR01784 family)
MLLLSRFKRVYLSELNETDEISIGLLKLVVEPEETAMEQARKLVAKSSLVELDLIAQILSSKFKQLNREEIQAMLGIKEELLKETGFYKQTFEEGKQEGETQGKLKTVPLFRRLGLSDEAIAKELGLSLKDVQSVPKSD